ncbi:MAG: hypothetical protein ACRDKH_00595 [Solirubrobacterales bacterium]
MGRRTLIAGLSALGCLSLMAPGAAAAKREPVDVSTRSVTATAPVEGVLTATATCPRKRKAIGGGWSTPPQAGSVFVPTESARLGDRRWRVGGYATTAGGPKVLTVEVYCARLSGRVKTSLASGSLGGTVLSDSSFAPTCPKRSRLMSGGFSFIGPDPITVLVYENALLPKIAPNAWSVSMLRGADSTSGGIRAFAYCLKRSRSGNSGPRKPRVLDATGQIPAPSLQSGSAMTPACPGRRRAISAGFSTPTPSGTQGGGLFRESRLVGDAAIASALQATDMTGTPLTAYVNCG